MATSLKYYIKTRSSLFVLLFGYFFLQLSCKTTGNQSETTRPQSLTKILRLTYDSTWVPNRKFQIRESGNLYGSGNTYLIDYLEKSEFVWVKISATDQENKHSFSYLLKENSEDSIKVFYFPWQNSRISILLKHSSKSENLIQCRWEGVYKGYLIIVESELFNSDLASDRQIADKLHTHVNESLSLY